MKRERAWINNLKIFNQICHVAFKFCMPSFPYIMRKGDDMQFTKFLLDNYLQTDGGKNALNFFKNLPGYVRAGDPDKIVEKFINNLLITPLANEFYEFNQEILKT